MKRRSQPKQRKSKGTYGPKRESGRMMYGGVVRVPEADKFNKARSNK